MIQLQLRNVLDRMKIKNLDYEIIAFFKWTMEYQISIQEHGSYLRQTTTRTAKLTNLKYDWFMVNVNRTIRFLRKFLLQDSKIVFFEFRSVY